MFCNVELSALTGVSQVYTLIIWCSMLNCVATQTSTIKLDWSLFTLYPYVFNPFVLLVFLSTKHNFSFKFGITIQLYSVQMMLMH